MLSFMVTEYNEVLPSEAVKNQYENNKTDEFLPPLIFSDHNQTRIDDGDVIVWFNFRADRARHLSEAFLLMTDGIDRVVD